MKKIIFCFILVILVTGFTLPAIAQTSLKGLDLVVIVDQSGSMTSRKKSRQPSDPRGVRNDMALVILNSLKLNATANKVTHRLCVVSFGSKSRLDLPLTEVSENNYDKLHKQLNSSLSDQNMGNTHFQAAFEDARQVFDNVHFNRTRERVIVLITDGSPYIANIRLKNYITDLKRFIKDKFPHPDYKFHVFALNDPQSTYWERYGDLWKELTHNNAVKLENSDEKNIFLTLNKFMNDLLATPSEHVEPSTYDNLIIPPYLETIVFNVLYTDSATRILLYPPDRDEPLTDRISYMNMGKTIQAITIRRPEPGKWRIAPKPDSEVDVYMQKFFPRGKLLKPGPDEKIRQYRTTKVHYQVVDSDDRPIKELPNYPFQLGLKLIKPDNKVEIVQMWRSSDQDPFETLRDIDCDIPGVYRTEVSIATKDLTGRTVSIFQDKYSSFVVEGTTLIRCVVERPATDEAIPFWGPVVFYGRPVVPISVRFENENGRDANMLAITRNRVKDAVRLNLLNNDEQLLRAVDLKSRSMNRLIGQLDGFDLPGKYKLAATANSGTVPDYYTIKVIPSELMFRLYLTPSHWAQLITAALIILCILFFSGHKLWINWRYPIKGALFLERQGGNKVWNLKIKNNRHKMTVKKKDLPLQADLKKILVRAQKTRDGGIFVTVIDQNNKLLADRPLSNRGTAKLKERPYMLVYKK
ncbi:MAG: VWA domain-containing protein [Desulfobacterales bacterium]|nr:VWA domain-containing protein [Desulfobacterales bacterium]